MSVFTMNRYPVHMSHSNVVPSNSMERQRPPVVKQECSSENDDPDAKAIHSGHFMLSRIHGSYASDDDDDDEGAPDRSPVQSGFNFVDASKETCRTYKFGPKSTQTLAIDASLSKLFDKLALAYSGKLTSPKWKQFRGMHLKVVDKIRLNNVIWREWVMQYVHQRHPIVCQFATPLSDEIHTKPEAIVLEGYYWKRRLDTITEEYKMSRKFFKRLVERRLTEPELNLSDEHDHSELLDKVGEVHSLTAIPRQQQTSSTDLILNSRDLQDMMDLSDSLFSNLNSPFAFPNPRELSGFGYGDFIQPGLLQLQPILEEDFMELEPIPDMFSKPLSTGTHSVLDTQAGTYKSPIDVEMMPSPQIPEPPSLIASPQIIASPQPMTPTPSPAPSTPGSSSLFQSPQPSPASGDSQMMVDTDIILNTLQFLQQQQNEQKQQRQKQLQQQQQQERKKQQELKKQKFIEQQKRLQQQKLLEQQKQLEEQQKKQEQAQQQQERQKQLVTLQTNLMKAHQAGNTQVAAVLLDELLKVLTSGSGSQFSSTSSPQTASVLSNQTASQTNSVTGSQTNSLTGSQTNSLTGSHTNSLTGSQTNSLSSAQHQTDSVDLKFPTSVLNPQILSQTDNQQNLSQDTSHSAIQSAFQQSIHFNNKQLHQLANSPSEILAALNAGNQTINLSEPVAQNLIKKIVLPKPSLPKKDNSGFTVPVAPPLGRGKQRILAPAPSQPQTTSSRTPTLSQQSYLAQLLTTGTYPGAIIKVKSEAEKPSCSTTYTPILPADAVTVRATTTSNSNIKSIQTAPASISIDLQQVTDFPTSMLLAAATHAFSPAVSVQEMLQSASKQDTAATGTSSVSMVTSPGQTESPQSPSFSLGPVPTSPVSVSSQGSFFDETKSLESTLSLDDSEFRKSTHITAELKRRQNIKGGFDLLHTLIPSISQNPSAKVSKAAMLQKTAEYCKKLKSERSQMQNEADILKQEINALNQAISVCQSQLPATGVPFNRQRADEMNEMFEEYVKQRTLTNWKFWIFSKIISKLFESFNNMVSTASVDELCRTVLAWLDQYCSLVALRPIASEAMRTLSTSTSILSDPSRVPEQAAQAVIKKPTDKQSQT